MKNITLLLFTFISLHTIGQKKFAQLDHELPTANEYRTASGAPGHRYYQQKADYKMDVSMDVKTFTYKGTQEIVYTNNSPDTLQKVYIMIVCVLGQGGRERPITDTSKPSMLREAM